MFIGDRNGSAVPSNGTELERRPPHDISAWLNMVLLVCMGIVSSADDKLIYYADYQGGDR